VEHLVEPGELDPDSIHLPGVYVDRVVSLTAAQACWATPWVTTCR
jgi:acyl CoA:acetate/3-ketoacid CoA transferase alpha subunit